MLTLNILIPEQVINFTRFKHIQSKTENSQEQLQVKHLYWCYWEIWASCFMLIVYLTSSTVLCQGQTQFIHFPPHLIPVNPDSLTLSPAAAPPTWHVRTPRWRIPQTRFMHLTGGEDTGSARGLKSRQDWITKSNEYLFLFSQYVYMQTILTFFSILQLWQKCGVKRTHGWN